MTDNKNILRTNNNHHEASANKYMRDLIGQVLKFCRPMPADLREDLELTQEDALRETQLRE